MKNESWKAIFEMYKIAEHDFNKAPFLLTSQMIKDATSGFTRTGEKEVRILCKHDCRESRPEIF